jgi:hypothetical protein
MGWKWRCVFYIYVTGGLITEATLVLNAYESGGFQRAHTISDVILLAAIYLTAAALWPLLIASLTFQYFGVLPRTMGP